jgi:hypothetical protein
LSHSDYTDNRDKRRGAGEEKRTLTESTDYTDQKEK